MPHTVYTGMASLAFFKSPSGLYERSYNERHMFVGPLSNVSNAVDQPADPLHTLTRIPICEKSWIGLLPRLGGFFFLYFRTSGNWENGSNKFSRLAFTFLLSYAACLGPDVANR